LNTVIEIVDNVFVRMFALPKTGDVHAGHAHVFDHITLLAKGTVLMRMSGYTPEQGATDRPHTDIKPERYYSAPALIVTPKGIVHEFEAKSDDCLLCCIHAIRDGDGLDDIAPQANTPVQDNMLMSRYPLLEIPEGTRA